MSGEYVNRIIPKYRRLFHNGTASCTLRQNCLYPVLYSIFIYYLTSNLISRLKLLLFVKALTKSLDRSTGIAG